MEENALKQMSIAIQQKQIAQKMEAKALKQSDIATQQKQIALDAINTLTYDMVDDLAAIPRTLPIVCKIYEKNISYLDKIFELDADSQYALREKGSNLDRIGGLWLQLGKTTKALHAFEKSLRIVKKLARDDPENSNAQRDLWVSYIKIGNVQQQLGNTQAALQAYEMAL